MARGHPTIGLRAAIHQSCIAAIIGLMATLSRSDVEHVAHLARLGLTDDELGAPRGPAQPHPRPVRDPRRRSPTDAHRRRPAQTIELENILRDDVVTRVADRSRPSLANAAGARRRLHRRPGDPRRRLTARDRRVSTELTRLHAHEMAARLRVGELSSRELTVAHLDVAERAGPRDSTPG